MAYILRKRFVFELREDGAYRNLASLGGDGWTESPIESWILPGWHGWHKLEGERITEQQYFDLLKGKTMAKTLKIASTLKAGTPRKTCPKCQTVQHSRRATCQNCEYAFPPKQKGDQRTVSAPPPAAQQRADKIAKRVAELNARVAARKAQPQEDSFCLSQEVAKMAEFVKLVREIGIPNARAMLRALED